jgi:hypothetical protein
MLKLKNVFHVILNEVKNLNFPSPCRKFNPLLRGVSRRDGVCKRRGDPAGRPTVVDSTDGRNLENDILSFVS